MSWWSWDRVLAAVAVAGAIVVALPGPVPTGFNARMALAPVAFEIRADLSGVSVKFIV